MCDCEELEMEGFEYMIASLSKRSPTPQVEEVLQAPVPLVAAKRKK